MATEIRVPTLGESVTEATVGKWFKKVGDTIAADEPLVELETDKVTVEVPAAGAGTLAEITVKEGETVNVGALLGSIAAGGQAAAPATRPHAVAQASSPDAASTVKQAAAETAKIAGGGGPIEPRTMPPAPAAAKLIAENNLAVDHLPGSGKRGQVLKGDVLDAIAKGAPSPPAEVPKAAPSPAPVAARAPSTAGDAAREEREKRGINDIYLLRVEQLYPFPAKALITELSRFRNAEMVWCQEEPKNMGAWSFIDPYLEWVLAHIDAKHQRVRYTGRPASASPATGQMSKHLSQLAAFLDDALGE